MTVRFIKWRGALPRAMLLAVAAALIPPPVAASDAKPAPKARTIQASMQDIVARDIATTRAPRTAMRRAEQSNVSKESSAFFKTKPGMIALAILAAGTGYALYSVKHDRVHSAGKK